MCTSLFLFLMLQIVLGSLAVNWLIAPPIQMVHRPTDFKRFLYVVLFNYLMMLASFFWELAAEEPRLKKFFFGEGTVLTGVLILMFLIMFLGFFYIG